MLQTKSNAHTHGADDAHNEFAKPFAPSLIQYELIYHLRIAIQSASTRLTCTRAHTQDVLHVQISVLKLLASHNYVYLCDRGGTADTASAAPEKRTNLRTLNTITIKPYLSI